MFLLVTAVAIGALLGSFVYLVEFARASRRDSLFEPARTGGTRRARRLAGVYTRDSQEELVLVSGRTGE